MSYAQTNAYSGKIAGLGYGAFRGLGDAAYDADHALWVQQKAAYDKAMAAYAGMSAGAGASYGIALSNYNRDLTAWNQEATAHTAAVVASQQQKLRNQRVLDNANAAARAAGVVTPAGYPGCVTQAQHNGWQADCSAWSAPVKGLGAAAAPSGPACALALLPVCPSPLPAIAPLRPKPTPPAPPPALTPPAPLRPEPKPPTPAAPHSSPGKPPVLNTGPQSIPSNVPSSAPSPAPASKSGGLLSNGLLVVVLAGTGYALYRTFKKPKAA